MCKNNKIFQIFQTLLNAITHSSVASEFNNNHFGLLDIFSHKALSVLIKKHCPHFRQRIFDPLSTLQLFIGQAISPDKSLAGVVHQVNTLRSLHNQKPISVNTSAYAQARKRLPLSLLIDLFCQFTDKVQSQTPDHFRWRGRQITIVDGTTFTMADTLLNRGEWEKHDNNKSGKSNFPMLKLVGVFDLFTGIIQDFVIAPMKGQGTGEASLFLNLLQKKSGQQVVMADSLYANYCLMARLLSKKIDFVLSSFGARKKDFRQGIRLGAP